MKLRQFMAAGLSILLAVSGVGPGYQAAAEEQIEAAEVSESSSDFIVEGDGEDNIDDSAVSIPEAGNEEGSGTELVLGDTETILPETEPESEAGTYQDTDLEGLIEEGKEVAKREGGYITNEQLIARQNIVTPPAISLEFRFTQVKKDYAVVKAEAGTRIYEEKKADSAVVGKIDCHGLCYVLEDKHSDWVYVESGEVRGFISASEINMGEDADRLVKIRGEEQLPIAELVLERGENDAYTYTHTTVYEVLADKVFAIADGEVAIYEETEETARVIGHLEDGGLCYILADEENDWVYVESGNARGFVEASSIKTGPEVIQIVQEQGENSMPLASVDVEPEENKACYYTVTSVRKASQAAITRSDMVNYSFQFLGNPYVWGGTSLTNGCDCSGFTQSIYAHFGYGLPRVAEAQAVYGMQIPVSAAEPGDLIFYAKNGYVHHVSMYIGNGQVIHAAGTSTGITISGIGSAAVWATRVIQ